MWWHDWFLALAFVVAMVTLAQKGIFFFLSWMNGRVSVVKDTHHSIVTLVINWFFCTFCKHSLGN